MAAGRALEARNNFRVQHDALKKLPQPGIADRGDNIEQPGVQPADIFLRVREEIRRVHFRFVRAANFFDGELEFVAVIFDARLDFHKIITLKCGRSLFEPVPHARLDSARGIAQFEAEIGFPLAGGADFFFTDKKVGGDILVGLQAGDEKLFHALGFFFGRIRSLLFDFFFESSLSFSGVAATSSIGSLFTAAVSV